MSIPVTFMEAPTDLVNQGSTSAALPAGYVLGMERIEDQKVYRLVKAGGSIGQYGLCKHDSSGSGGQVIATAAATDFGVGVCEVSGVTSGVYFWMTIAGVATTKVTGTLAVGDPIAASGTAATGQKAPFTATNGVIQRLIGDMVEANASGAANKMVRLAGLR